MRLKLNGYVASDADKEVYLWFGFPAFSPQDVRDALEQLPERDYEKRSAPTFIISNTVKGKGVSFMEGNHKWHGGGIGDEDLKIALADVAKMRKA